MITSFFCECGNTSPDKALEYDGSMGYEAIVCLDCEKYWDVFGVHKADTWSRGLVNEAKRKKASSTQQDCSAGLISCEHKVAQIQWKT